MRRRPLNMSAALALAVERQVEDILAQARTACALHRCARDDDGATFDDARRSGASAPAVTPPVAEPAPARPMDLWKRLRFAWAPRRYCS